MTGRKPPEDAVVLDAKGMRALAHPVRVRMLALLRTDGPSTATRLAEVLGVNSGAASYHLRQLGAAGFVEEDVERGNARERWWRSVHRSTWLDALDLIDRDPGAIDYLRSVVAYQTVEIQRAVNALQSMPRAWQNVFDASDWFLRLTPEEAVRLSEDLSAVIGRYRRDVPETAGAAPEGAERVAVITHILPDLDTPRTPETGRS